LDREVALDSEDYQITAGGPGARCHCSAGCQAPSG
jgi:hypothetical protein